MRKKDDLNQKKAGKDVFLDYMPYIIIIILVIILRTFIATPVRVNGTSMESTLHNGETMILNKIAMKLKGVDRWDIVVIKTGDTFLIKRIIGLPNETVKYKDDKLYINDKIVKDKYSLSKTEDFKKIKVGSDEYFVMGDNRYVSQDSRIIGPIKKDEVKGKTNIILFPLDRIGLVE
ncbi:MAG: signal peptidase I [Bacilli bacterium]|nr:signal peptidase I [Bacilli bacterium]MDD4406755.1 signal peptidase I [Bacilli bacterium]